MAQQQDLVFFSDGALVADAVFAKTGKSLHVVSYAHATKPTWLINSIVENCLAGTANSANRDLPPARKPRTSVTYVSFVQSKESVYRSFRKQGLDLDTFDEFQFVDCFGDLFSGKGSSSEYSTMLADVTDKVQRQAHNNKVVVVDSPEILLAGTSMTGTELIHSITKLNRVCDLVIVVVNTDSAMVDMEANNPADPVFQITDFYVKLHHKSSLNVNLSPLQTGKANDITGSLVVAQGALPTPSSISVLEREYVYHLSKEANVKLYFR